MAWEDDVQQNDAIDGTGGDTSVHALAQWPRDGKGASVSEDRREDRVEVTSADVAERVGVSRSTVSRALTGHPRIPAETRRRVREAADALGYRPNPVASMLARGSTRTIGMIVPSFTRHHSRVVSAAEEVFRANDLDLLLYRVREAEERSFLLEATPFRHRVDGLLLVSVLPAPDEIAHLNDLGVTVVTIGGHDPSLPSLRVDDEGGARRATEHLLELGHRRIGLLSGPAEAKRRYDVFRERRLGYEAAMADAGVAPISVAGEAGFDGGLHATVRLLSDRPDVTAVVAVTDDTAAGAMKALSDVGRHVPRDCSVVGFDDDVVAHALDLTTVNQATDSHGTRGAELLVERLAHPEVEPRNVVVPTRLIRRGTTGRPPESQPRRDGAD